MNTIFREEAKSTLNDSHMSFLSKFHGVLVFPRTVFPVKSYDPATCTFSVSVSQ